MQYEHIKLRLSTSRLVSFVSFISDSKNLIALKSHLISARRFHYTKFELQFPRCREIRSGILISSNNTVNEAVKWLKIKSQFKMVYRLKNLFDQKVFRTQQLNRLRTDEKLIEKKAKNSSYRHLVNTFINRPIYLNDDFILLLFRKL